VSDPASTCPAWIWVAGCGLACAVLLASEVRGRQAGVWIFKPAASACFVALAWNLGAADSGYGRAILVGLGLSMAGDVLLIPRAAPRFFLAGITSFLCGHLAYAVAFCRLGVALLPALGLLLGLAPLAVLVLRWLRPALQGLFAVAVPVYVVVIFAMVALAGAASWQHGVVLPALGAALFALSDVAVARDRFIAPSLANGAWGLPTYFVGQLVLAASVVEVAAR